jgi:hypothetical protein
MKRSCFAAVAVFFVSALTVFGQNENTNKNDTTLFSIPFNSPRANGMGGNHATLADDFETIFVNPAGFTTAEDKLSVAALDATVRDIDTTLRLISSEFSDPVVYASRIKDHYETGISSNGPLMIGSIRGDAGWAFLNRQYLKMWWERNNIFIMNANIVEEIAFYFGRSFPITNFEDTYTITPGFTIKPNYRLMFAPREVPFFDFRHIFRNLRDQPFESQLGLGVNVGVLVTYFHALYLSVVANDLLSPVYVSRYTSLAGYSDGNEKAEGSVEFIKPSVDVSICFRTKNVFPGEIVRDIVFALDFHLTSELLDRIGGGSIRNIGAWLDRNSLLNIGAGLEFHLLRAFWIRVGWQQMLPAAGFGMDFGTMKLDVAVFGETFGDRLTDYKGASFSLGLSFRY